MVRGQEGNAMPLERWKLGLASALAVVMPGAVLAYLLRFPSPWERWRPATCMPDACFCEAIRESIVRQPVNVVTSLVFVAAAVYVLGRRSDALRSAANKNPILRSSVYVWLYAAALVVIGVGSAFYHASLTFIGQTSDVLGMYLLGTFILLYNWARVRPTSANRVGVTYVLGNILLLALLIWLPELRRWTFAALVLGAIGLEIGIRRRRTVVAKTRLFSLALAAMGVGFAIWVLDITRFACSAQSPVQGHGVWHVLGAVSSCLVFLYYLSEDESDTVEGLT